MTIGPGIFVLPVAIALSSACADRNQAAYKEGGNPGVGTVDLQRPNNAPFVSDMLEDGRAEVELGHLAQQRASNAAVREFGAVMVRDHTKAGDELKAVASDHGDSTHQDSDADHKRLHDNLRELSGDAFDREYIDAMVKEHEEAVRELEQKSESPSNDPVKQWAAKTLPAVRQHLERAKQIQQMNHR
jgi:putative membrane protein